jgi:hypothetical protein
VVIQIVVDDRAARCWTVGMVDDLKLTPAMLEALRSAPTKSDLKLTRLEPCLCGKLLDVITWGAKWHSGRFHEGKMIARGINYTALLCEGCLKEFEGWPRIVCLKCRAMGFYKPGRQATGFVFEKNRHYHIATCPKCDSSSMSTPVLEHEWFCRHGGIKTVTNFDLLQEIEQKTLQGIAETEKLRAEYNSSVKS